MGGASNRLLSLLSTTAHPLPLPFPLHHHTTTTTASLVSSSSASLAAPPIPHSSVLFSFAIILPLVAPPLSLSNPLTISTLIPTPPAHLHTPGRSGRTSLMFSLPPVILISMMPTTPSPCLSGRLCARCHCLFGLCEGTTWPYQVAF
ncbi:hypothetical protein M0R45_006964 [Rubus argutus]|uniref:Uncharacterized protein n=1 Tax=Rubus argutus TaxID=59490 RepID=A0AAW1YS41_RUBAR